MKKMIALLLIAVLSIVVISSAMATTGYYNADYTIVSGKIGYSPSTIYGARNGYSHNSYATYHLENYTTAAPPSTYNYVKVHIWNRQLGKQVTSRLPCQEYHSIDLEYNRGLGPSYTYKPVTYKVDTAHYNYDVALDAEFLP